MKVNKKGVIGLGAIIASGVLLAGCAGGGGDNTADEQGGGGATLTVWVDQNRADALKDSISQFEEENDVTVDLVVKQNEKIRDDFTADILKGKGFKRVDLATDFNLTLKKLLLGRIDLMPIAEDYYVKLRRDGTGIEKVLVLSEQIYSVACNKAVPDETIAKMQKSLDKLIADGTQAALFRKYGLDIESQ